MPAPKKQPLLAQVAPYKLPSYETLAFYGFEPEACIPSINPQGFPGKQGSTKGIQIYPGYKGSTAICIVLLAPFEYTLGPLGPVPPGTPIVKLKARTGEEFREHLYAAGYPTPETKKALDKSYYEAQLESWQAECEFIEFMNKGRINKHALPKKPTQ